MQPDATLGRAVLSSALAVLAVVVLVVALLAAFGHAVNSGGADPAGAAAPATATPTTPGRTGVPSQPAAPQTPANNGKKGEPTESPDAPKVPDIGVVVLNQSSREGLAADVARDLEAAGWRVTDTDNWRGSVPETTVYYPSGFATAAETLAAALNSVDRTRPRQSNMPVGVLTVILHDSYTR